jgi:hypothetical protein
MAIHFLPCLKSGLRILRWVSKAKMNRVAQISRACKNEETGRVNHKTKKCVFVSKPMFHFKPTASPSSPLRLPHRFAVAINKNSRRRRRRREPRRRLVYVCSHSSLTFNHLFNSNLCPHSLKPSELISFTLKFHPSVLIQTPCFHFF